MRVVVTGARGWLGHSVTRLLAEEHTVRAHDLRAGASESAAESTYGDLTDWAVAQQAVDGMDAVVHLISGSTLGCSSPYDWIRTGVGVVANTFEAAATAGVKRFVLMSSGAVVVGHRGVRRVEADTAPSVTSTYGLTKWLEEVTAGHYAANRGLVVPILRPWLIVDGPTRTVKGGRPLDESCPQLAHDGVFGWVDRDDVAEACRLALVAPVVGAPVFHLFASALAEPHFDLSSAREALGWRPRHTFDDVATGTDRSLRPDGR